MPPAGPTNPLSTTHKTRTAFRSIIGRGPITNLPLRGVLSHICTSLGMHYGYTLFGAEFSRNSNHVSAMRLLFKLVVIS